MVVTQTDRLFRTIFHRRIGSRFGHSFSNLPADLQSINVSVRRTKQSSRLACECEANVPRHRNAIEPIYHNRLLLSPVRLSIHLRIVHLPPDPEGYPTQFLIVLLHAVSECRSGRHSHRKSPNIRATAHHSHAVQHSLRIQSQNTPVFHFHSIVHHGHLQLGADLTIFRLVPIRAAVVLEELHQIENGIGLFVHIDMVYDAGGMVVAGLFAGVQGLEYVQHIVGARDYVFHIEHLHIGTVDHQFWGGGRFPVERIVTRI